MENNIEEPSSPPAVIVLPGQQPLEQTQSQEDGISTQEPEKFMPINLRWWVLCLMVFLVMLVGLSIGIGVELHRKAKLPAEEDYAAGPASPTSSPPPPTNGSNNYIRTPDPTKSPTAITDPEEPPATETTDPSPPSPRWTPDPNNPPNILMIGLDDMNDWVGFLGKGPPVLNQKPGLDNTTTATPNMDKLAYSPGATIFEHAYVPSPVCNPSRSAILTGVRPTTSGIYGTGVDWWNLVGGGAVA